MGETVGGTETKVPDKRTQSQAGHIIIPLAITEGCSDSLHTVTESARTSLGYRLVSETLIPSVMNVKPPCQH